MILTLDLATCTGFCFGSAETGARPTIGHVDLPKTGSNVGSYLISYENWLVGKLAEVEPLLIVFEAPILMGRDSSAVTRKLHALPGITEVVAIRAGIECAEVNLASIKKALTGKGNAKKPEMVAACRAYGFDPKTTDEADAFGLWLHTVRLRHPAHAWRWEPLSAGSLT